MNDIIILLGLITLPIVIPIVIVMALTGRDIKNTLSFNEETGLSSQGLLWISILSPFLYFISFGFICWHGYSISLTSEGLQKFFTISALPFAALSLALPLSILVSRLHATKQTAKQIQITQQKNNIDLFNSHRKELFSYFSQIGAVNYFDCLSGEFKPHPRVHKTFFTGKPENGIPLINENAFKKIEYDLSTAKWQLDSIIKNKNPDLTFTLYIANFCSSIYNLSFKLGLPEIHDVLAQKSILVPVILEKKETKELLTVGKTTDEAIAAYRYV